MARALRSLTLVFLAARAGAQKDSCATGAEGRWAGTHARLLALDESKLPNLYQRKLEFENITGASIDIEQKSIKDWAGAVFSDAKTARLEIREHVRGPGRESVANDAADRATRNRASPFLRQRDVRVARLVRGGQSVARAQPARGHVQQDDGAAGPLHRLRLRHGRRRWEPQLFRALRRHRAAEIPQGERVRPQRPRPASPPPMKAAQRSEVIELNTCFCIPSGRVDLVAQCTKNAYEGGETPAVDYGIRNESSRALSAVKIKIKRQIWFKARGHQKRFKNTIVCRSFAGVEAGGVFGFDGLPMRRGELPLPAVVRGPRGFQLFSIDSPTIKVRYWLKIEATTTAVAVRSARLRLMDVQIYRTAPWRATAVFAGAERDDDDDDDGLAWGEVISYEPSPDLGDVPVAVPIPSAPPAEAIRA